MELRKDYILDRWSIIAPKRSKRPRSFKQPVAKTTDDNCPFCPGKEDQTPPEIGRVEENKEWKIRWFSNKFGFLDKGNLKIQTHNKFYTFAKAAGKNEVIVETRDHKKQLHNLSIEHITEILRIYVQRIKELSKTNKYVVIFKNQGINAGTSLVHLHTQVAAINIEPPMIKKQVQASFENGKCLYCDIVKSEKEGERRVFENNDFVSFCPYAPRFNFETWIFPKKHIRSITDLNKDQLTQLA